MIARTDIEKIFTDYSRTFNLPASKTNNKIFKHWYNPDIDGFDNQIFSSARIELNHLHFEMDNLLLKKKFLELHLHIILLCLMLLIVLNPIV